MTTLDLENANGAPARVVTKFISESDHGPSVLFDFSSTSATSYSNLSLESAKQLHSTLTKVMQEIRDFESRPQVVGPAEVVTYKGRTYFIMGKFEFPETHVRYEAFLNERAHLVLDANGQVVKNRGSIK